jgi:hypothetical protein
MLHISMPDDAYLSDTNDKGKHVIINSVGGAFVNVPGVVIVGPCVYPYVHKEEIKAKRKSPLTPKRYKSEDRLSCPLWVVEVGATGRHFSFMRSEIEFKNPSTPSRCRSL